MNVRNIKKEKKVKCWQEHIENYHNSRLSQPEYCMKHGLKISTLGYWITKLKRISESRDLVRVPIKLPARVSEIQLVIKDQIMIPVKNDFDPVLLSKVLQTLGVDL